MMRVMTPERDWERLGRAFAKARKDTDLSQTQVAEQLHVSRTAVQAIERGRQSNGASFIKVTTTMRAYARLVGWTEKSPDIVADGGEPEPSAEQQQQSPTEQPSSDLPPAIDLELRTGKTIDHTVVHLGPEEEDARIIVVLKGAEDLSEEELEKLWHEWRRTRRQLQGMSSDPDNVKDS